MRYFSCWLLLAPFSFSIKNALAGSSPVEFDTEQQLQSTAQLTLNDWNSVQSAFTIETPPQTSPSPENPKIKNNSRPVSIIVSLLPSSVVNTVRTLNWTLHHPPEGSPHKNHHGSLPFHRLAWLVNHSQPTIDALSDPSASLTLFAPDDDALTPPKPSDHHHSSYDDKHVFWNALNFLQSSEGTKDTSNVDKRKIFQAIIDATLKYHIVPKKLDALEILDHSTLPTLLKFAAPPSRIRVGIKHKHVDLNFATQLDGSLTVLTKNGIIYTAKRHPLLPPLTPLSQLFLAPSLFSTLTSAAQKVDLDHVLLPKCNNKTHVVDDGQMDMVDERVQGILRSIASESEFKLRAFTVFAPTNKAFQKLGPSLNAFLFSPFGARVLRYVLSYHISPDVIWYTDHEDKTGISLQDKETTTLVSEYMIQINDDQSIEDSLYTKGFPRLSHRFSPKIHSNVNITHYSLPTLLGSASNQTLNFQVVQYRLFHGHGPIVRRVVIKSPCHPSSKSCARKHEKFIPVFAPDVPAWGGAIHVIGSVIPPPIPPGPKQEDFEEFARLSASGGW
uniref:Fasciclin n=1 Tax=Hemileia vastatrix TaxID=203904 RepID=T1UNY4_9BASI|nr:fasciclin [Hemileia vastatrix]